MRGIGERETKAKKALLDKPYLYLEIEAKNSRPPVPTISARSKRPLASDWIKGKNSTQGRAGIAPKQQTLNFARNQSTSITLGIQGIDRG